MMNDKPICVCVYIYIYIHICISIIIIIIITIIVISEFDSKILGPTILSVKIGRAPLPPTADPAPLCSALAKHCYYHYYY